VYFVGTGVAGYAYRDKKVVGVFVRFCAPLHGCVANTLSACRYSDARFPVFASQRGSGYANVKWRL
jgi:hypothetical protein